MTRVYFDLAHQTDACDAQPLRSWANNKHTNVSLHFPSVTSFLFLPNIFVFPGALYTNDGRDTVRLNCIA
jgi:hypothetical protein